MSEDAAEPGFGISADTLTIGPDLYRLGAPSTMRSAMMPTWVRCARMDLA